MSSDPDHDRATWILAPVALLLVLSALVLPVWTSTLAAPQYPEGLELVVYGDRAEGDLAEIDSLNHYIGMSPLRLEEFPELALWPLGLVAAGVAVLAGLLTRGVLARLARIYLWLFPLLVLAVIQFRLHQFGHDLDPNAAFRMEGFTPWAVGSTRVWNFTAWGWPGSGLFALLGAAALVTFGPAATRRIAGVLRRSFAVAALVALSVVGALPASAHSDHDHSGHERSTDVVEPHSQAGTVAGTHASPSQVGVDPARLIDLEALIAATPQGGVLTLPAGAYRGGIVVDRPMTIEGVGMPIVVGGGEGTVMTITAPGTVIRGIHVTGSGHGPSGQPAGIRVVADGVELDGVVVDDSYIGIAIDGVERVRILDSLILGRSGAAIDGEGHAVDGSHHAHTGRGRGDGISLWDAEAMLIRGTRIQDVRDGIYASFGSSVLVDANHVLSSRYAIHTMYTTNLVVIENRFESNLSGAVLMYGGQVDVIRNAIADNTSPSTGFGILLKDVVDAELVQNAVTSNRVGIHIDGPAGDTPIRVTANTVADNQFGVMVFPSAPAVFMANSFVDNLVQVSQQGRGAAAHVLWSDRGWGNYWSTYRGYDNGRGRGVVPHAEASSVNRVLVRSPLLTPLATSPAMRIIGAIEDRWLQLTPVAVDELPLIDPASPPVASTPPDANAVMMAGVAGFALVLASTGGFFRFARRPRMRGAT